MDKLKKIVLKSFLAKPSKDLEAFIQERKIKANNNQSIKGYKTIYCISPYKTGTTFLSSCYDNLIAKHEPAQYCTLKNLSKNFNFFFIRRLNVLNLKLECSGYLSAYVKELSENEISKKLTYICLLRSPSSWVTSVVNYWETLSFLKFDYINEYFWKQKLGIDMVAFKNYNSQEKDIAINKMIKFYLNYLKQTRELDNVHYIDLKKVNDFLPKLDLILEEEAKLSSAWKRENKSKKFKYENKEADNKYEILVSQLKEEN